MLLLQALTALLAVAGLAWLVLRLTLPGAHLPGMARGASRRHLRLLERLPLDPQRSLYLIQLGDKVFLVSTGSQGAAATLAELSAEELPDDPDAGYPSPERSGWLRDFLGRTPFFRQDTP